MMNHLNRRDMIKLALSGIFIPALINHSFAGFIPQDQLETILSGYRVDEDDDMKDAGLHIGGINVNERIKLANEIHSICFSEKLKLRIFLPKLNSTAYVQSGDGTLFPFAPEKDHYFYGHGVIDEKRKLLYTTQAIATKDKNDSVRLNVDGFIFVHSLPDMKPLGKFPTYGKDPHDFIMNGDDLLVCNGGRNTSITIIDLSTRKLKKTFLLGDPDLSLRHIARIDDQNYAIGTLRFLDNLPCPLYHLNLEGGLGPYYAPPALGMNFMKGQLLSVFVHQNHVYATCPTMNSLLVWTTKGDFVGGQIVPKAASLAYSHKNRGVIVGSGVEQEPARLAVVRNGELQITKLEWAKGITGSHSVIL